MSRPTLTVSILERRFLIFYLMLVIDALLVILHILLGKSMWLFHLDIEQNLPTYYQSAKLILFGSFFLITSLKHTFSFEIKSFIIPLSLALIGLGLDELLQIHENIYKVFQFIGWLDPEKVVTATLEFGYRSSLWIIYYIPIIFLFVLWCGYWLRYFQSTLKSNFKLITISILSLFAVLLLEVLSSTGLYSDEIYFWMITGEEYSEMLFASTLILISAKVLAFKLRVR